MNRLLPIVFFSVLLLLSGAPAQAQTRTPDQTRDRYQVSVLTISPGDPVFFRFGHNALLVRDMKTLRTFVFNWGTFSFQEPHLVEKFLRGRLTYWLSVQGLTAMKVHYKSENRWIVEQRLNLTRAQKAKLVRLVWENARPENRAYRYDYYRDNCSTRIRDLIDKVTDGRLHDVSRGPATLTFRGETSRLVADVWWGYMALNLAMGDYIDQPVTRWEQMFVPMNLRDELRLVKNIDDEGRVVPLVASERKIVTADRKDPPAEPPDRRGILLLLGLLMGAAFGGVTYWYFSWPASQGKTPWSRRLAFGLPLFVWTLLTGFFAFMFIFFWTVTDHQVAYHNENLFQMNPLTIALPVMAVGLLFDKAWAKRTVRFVLLASVALSGLGLVLKVLPWFDQANGEMIAWLLPIWAGMAAGVVVAERRAEKVEPDGGAEGKGEEQDATSQEGASAGQEESDEREDDAE